MNFEPALSTAIYEPQKETHFLGPREKAERVSKDCQDIGQNRELRKGGP